MTADASGETPAASGEASAIREPGAWNPRRSLATRLLWYVVPIALVPTAVYWIAVDRIGREQRAGIMETLLSAERQREVQALADDSREHVRELREAARKVAGIARQAADAAARALAAGPDPQLPAEALVEAPGGALRTATRGVSAAMVSRRRGSPAEVQRDLAATRRLEGAFVVLGLGPVDVSALSIRTASGVLRVVPGLDLFPGGTPVVDPGFGFPTVRAPAPAEASTAAPSPVAWTDVYEDRYAGSGNVVSAVADVKSPDGRSLAEVAVDWTFPRLLQESVEPDRAEEVGIVFTEDGRPVVIEPASRISAETAQALGTMVSTRGDGVLDVSVRDSLLLVSVRRIPELRWIFAKVTARSALEKRVANQVQPIFDATSRKRNEARLGFIALIGLFAAAVLIAMRRELLPLRRVARAADAIAFGKTSIPPFSEVNRRDEIGRLYRAMTDLDRRVRWRIASMEGVHRLAQTAALMTRPEETFAQLTRQIAELVGASKAWICLWEPETHCLVLSPPGFGVPDEALGGRRIGLDDHSLAIVCYRTGETFLQNDVTSDTRLSKPLTKILGIEKNIVFAPLKAEMGILGVLAVADKPGGFDAEDQTAIDGYAGEAALLLRNARLYEELQRSYERLREAQRNRDYFLQNINHELRTPLTAILGWSEVLTEGKTDGETVRIAVDQINRSAQFLLALISDLLDLSRFEEGRTRLEPEDVDLGLLVSESVEPVSVMAEAKGIRTSLFLPKEETIVRVDPIRLRQVLWNIVHNAVKFTAKGGEISVEASADATGVFFNVSDNGVGIDAKDLPLIFERFRQIDGSATRAYRGMGIGLALAKAYVELHGGSIQVESQLARGTTFRIRLPRIPAGASARADVT